MKKSYKIILAFEILLFILFFLNTFVIRKLGLYGNIIILLSGFIAFKFILGYEKNKSIHSTELVKNTIIYLIAFFIIYYLFGLIIGFARTGNYFNLSGFKNFIIPIIISVIISEILRYTLLVKSSESKILVICTTVLFCFQDIVNGIYLTNFNEKYSVFLFIATVLLPAISTNIAGSYVTYKAGFKPAIVFILPLKIYQYILPIVPNANEYITAIVNLIVPLMYCYTVYSYFMKLEDYEIDRYYNRSKRYLIIFPLILTAIIIYFTSGYFKYYAISIATGSMKPNINVGDVVVIEKIEDDYKSIKKGDIIAFKYNGIIIVHRVIKIIYVDKEYIFYTKGDANPSEDGYPIKEDMIIGTVSTKIPYIGYPTVWLNN